MVSRLMIWKHVWIWSDPGRDSFEKLFTYAAMGSTGEGRWDIYVTNEMLQYRSLMVVKDIFLFQQTVFNESHFCQVECAVVHETLC